MKLFKFKGKFIVLLIVFTLLLSIFCIKYVYAESKRFKIEPRIDNIKSEKKSDNEYKTIGWIRIEGTSIDVPVIISDNHDYSYPVERESFAWSLSTDDKFHKKIDIMGHNIFNLSSTPGIESDLYHRFEQLMAFVYYDFAKENKYIQLTIGDQDYVYKIYAVNFVESSVVNKYVTDNHDDEEYVSNQYKLLKKESLFSYDVDLSDDDDYISLITCTRFFGPEPTHNFVVSGRLLRKNEKIKDYKVEINKKNYEKIDDILKGDDSNEEDSV